MSTQAHGFAPLDTRTGKPIALAMQRLWLGGEVTPAGARLSVRHEFRSDEKEPLEVIYAFPLPRDAALHKFRIVGDGFEVHSELKPADEAAKVYEEAIAKGSLAGLIQQYGDGVVNLTLGNIRPGEMVTVELEMVAGVELNDDGFRFRFPFTLAPRYHARARYFQGEIELPADEFGSVILPPLRADAKDLHEIGFDLALCGVSDSSDIGSPSHAIRVRRESGRSRLTLATASDVPDRDLVLDCGFRDSAPAVLAAPAAESKTRFAIVVPSTCFGETKREPRRVVFLLDRSGSMQGSPMAQARKAIEACLAVLSESDEFGIVAFDNASEGLNQHLLPGTKKNRERAAEFLRGIDARGGTEIVQGMETACKLIGSPDADIVIFTDGQVAGTEQVLAKSREQGARLHTLGIGSAAQDRFLTLLARETGGTSRCVNPDERVDLAAVNLFASVGRPIATGLKTDVPVRPELPSIVTAGAPLQLFGETTQRVVTLEWDGGRLPIPIAPQEEVPLETLRLLQGARLITDWESRYPAAEALAPLEVRQQSRVANRLRQLSEEFGLASREMSLVAVVTRPGDRADDLPVTRVVPVGMPRGVAMEAYFGSVQPMLSQTVAAAKACFAANDMAFTLLERHPSLFRSAPASSPQGPVSLLVELASRLEPDGGMPGKPEERVALSAIALLAFVSNGHTERAGAFRLHVRRLIAFVKKAQGLSERRQMLVQAVLDTIAGGSIVQRYWLELALDGTRTPWTDLAVLAKEA